MDYLVITIFEDFVAVNIFDVEMGIKTEPLLILTLVGYLDRKSIT